MIETDRALAYGRGMVGHPAQRYMAGSFPGQHVPMPYSHAAIAAAIQAPNNHILAQAGLAQYRFQDVYGLLAKQQQQSPLIPSQTANTVPHRQPHDQPIGYVAFGVVWLVLIVYFGLTCYGVGNNDAKFVLATESLIPFRNHHSV